MSNKPAHERILESLEGDTMDFNHQESREAEKLMLNIVNNINISIKNINRKGEYSDNNYIFVLHKDHLIRIDKDNGIDTISCKIADFNSETARKYDSKIIPMNRKLRLSSFIPFIKGGSKRKYTKRRRGTKRRR